MKGRNSFRKGVIAILSFTLAFTAFPFDIAFAATTSIRQEINITDAYYFAGSSSYATSSEIVLLTDNYSNPTYYFEVVASTTGATTATVTLVNATSSASTTSLRISGGNTYTRYRSLAFTPTSSSTEYKVVLNNEATGKGIISSRIVVLQNTASLTNTETQIEIGNNEQITSTATTTFASPKYWYYDSTKWDGSPTFYAEVTWQTINAGLASSTTYSTAGTFSVSLPVGTASTSVGLWGGGGAGGGTINANEGGDGGAGGQFASSTVEATSTSLHTLVVAATTAGTVSVAGPQGATSTWDGLVVVAGGGPGGLAGQSTSASTTGNTIGCVGTKCFAGGNAGAGSGTYGAGGGEGASTGANGNSATGAGVAGTGGAGGDGGAVRTTSGTGNAGTQTGGGGGGGFSTNGTDRTGGTGAAGQALLTTYIATTTIALQVSDGTGDNFTGWADVAGAYMVTNDAEGISTRARSTSFSPTSGRNYRIAARTSYTNSVIAIYNAKIIVVQTSPTLLEPQYLLANTKLASGTGLQKFLTSWNSAEWANVTTSYIHEVDAANGSASVVEVDTAGGTQVNGSVVSSPDNRGQSSAMAMPANGDLDIKATPTNNNDIYASRILVQVSPPPAIITVSGTIYTNEGSTQLTTAGKTLNIRFSTSTPGIFSTTTLAANGFWQIPNITATGISSGVPIQTWIDGDATFRAFTFTKASSSSNSIPNIDLYQNRVIVKHEGTSGTSTTNTDLGNYDGDNNSSIQFTSNSGSLSVLKGQELHVWTGDTFAPDGSVTLHGNAAASPDGDFHIDDNAIVTLGGGLSVAGNFTMDPGTTFTPGVNTTTFTATTTGKTISGTLTGANNELENITFNGVGGAWTFSNNASTTNFTITNGTVTAPSLLTVLGNYSNSGTFTNGSGTVYISSTTAQTLDGTMTGASAFNNIQFLNSATKTFNANASTSAFTINSSSGAVNISSRLITLSGTYTNSGTLTSNTGTIYFASGSSIAAGSNATNTSALGNVNFLTSLTFPNNASTSDFTITSGTVTAPTVLSIAGNYSNSGTFTNNSGTTTFNGTSAQTLSGTMTGTSLFNNVEFSGAGTKTFNASASTTNFAILSGSGAVTAPAAYLTISGNYSIKSGTTFTHNSGTIFFTSTSNIGIDQQGSSFNNVEFNNGLVGYWRFDEGTASTTADGSGFGNTATLNSNTLWSTEVTSTSTYSNPYSLSFDGIDDSLTVPDSSVLNNVTGTFTVTAWVRLNAAVPGGVFPRIVEKKVPATGTSGFDVALDSTGGGLSIRGSGSTLASPSCVSGTWGVGGNLNTWIPIAVVFSGTTVTSYCNGVLGSSGTIDTVVATTTSVTIATLPFNSSGLFTGNLDEVRIYNRALSVGEIYDLSTGNAPTSTTVTLNAAFNARGNFGLRTDRFDIAAWTINIGGNFSNYGVFKAQTSGGTTIFDGTSTQTLSGTMTGSSTLNALQFSAAGTKTISGNASTSGFTINSGSGAVTAPSLLTITGNYSNSATFTNNSGIIYATSSSAQTLGGTMTGSSALNNIQFFGSGTKTFNANASTSDFTIVSGSGAVTAPSLLTITGNYSNSATFTNGSGTVYISSTSAQTLSGALTGTSAFYNLNILNNSATTTFASAASTTNNFVATQPNTKIAFKLGATSTLTNFTITGSSGNEVRIWSDTPGSTWNLHSTGTQAVTYASIKDSDACSSGSVTASNSIDVSNNFCWSFSTPLTFSGTIYTNEGSTQMTTSGRALMLRIATSTPGIFSTTTVAANGFWQITNIGSGGISPGVPIQAWIDSVAAFRAFTFTKASSTTNNITGLDLYQNRIIVKHEGTSGTSTTNTDLGNYDADNNSSIQFTSNGGTLSVLKAQELHIWTGKTFAPGGTITLHGNAAVSPDGDFHIDDNSVVTLGGNLSLAGDLTVDPGTTFTPGANTTTFTATTTSKTISGTLIGASNSLGNLTFNGSGGAWSFSNSASTTDLTITAGTLTAPTLLSISGNYSNSGSFTDNSGTTTFNGTSAQTLGGTMNSASTDFAKVEFSGSGTKTFNANASTTNFAILSGSGTVTAPSLLTINGNYSNSATFTHNSGTIFASSTSAQAFSGTATGTSAFNNVIFSASGAKTFNANASTSDFTIRSGSGAVTAPSLLTVSGNYSNSATYTNNSGTIYISSTSAQTLGGTMTNTSAFNNIQFLNSGTKTFNANASTSDFTIQSGSGAVTAPSLLSISANYSNSGTFTTSGTTTFNGTSAQTLGGTMTSTSLFNNIEFSGSGTKTFNANASSTNFAILLGSGAVTAPSLLTVSGNYSNSGTFTNNSGTIYATSSSAQSFSGTMTGTSALNNIEFFGSGTKTFNSKASTTDFTIKSGVTTNTGITSLATSTYNQAGTYTYTVPAGVSSITIRAWSGGGAGGGGGQAATGGNGAGAGFQQGTVSVSSGDTFTVYVGGGGGGGGNNTTGGAGGTNGGGKGGDETLGFNIGGGGGGGGYSGVFKGSTLYIVAGGGGGGGGGDDTSGFNGVSGGPGGGVSGTAGTNYSGSVTGGGGGTSSAGGAAGVGEVNGNAGGSLSGAAGVARTGSWKDGGGGGGGGNFGGGSGGGGFDDNGSAGGGGGSSAAGGGVTNTSTNSGSGTSAGNNTDPGYCCNAGNGGTGGATGSAGSVGNTGLVLISPGEDISNIQFSIAGNFTNNGTFGAPGTTTLSGSSQQTLSGTMVGSSAFNNLIVLNTSGSDAQTSPSVIFANVSSTTGTLTAVKANTKIRFPIGATTTIGSFTLNGQNTATRVTLRSSTVDTQWGLKLLRTSSISNTDVQDSNACTGLTVDASGSSNLDSGNNSCWSLPQILTIASAANQFFSVNDSATPISTITVTDGGTPTITAANDLRIPIATSTVRMLWDTTDTTATIGGTASGKVSSTVSYEGGGSVLKINATSDFAGLDTLTISGLSFKSFSAVNILATALGVRNGGVGDLTNDANDTKKVAIKGTVAKAAHTAGQQSNLFQSSGSSLTNFVLYRFRLNTSGENVTVSGVTFALTGVHGFSSSDITNTSLIIDYNGNGVVDGGEDIVGGSGLTSISGQTGTITFSSSFTATTSRDYILKGDVANIDFNHYLTIDVPTANITSTGVTSVQSITASGSGSGLQHIKIPGGGSGLGSDVSGAGIVPGGGSGGSGLIGSDPGFFAPATLGALTQWTTSSNAYTSDNQYATSATNGNQSDYKTFSFSVPAGDTITGIEVKLESSASTAAGTISVSLSWNNGTNFTSTKTTGTLTTADAVYTLGTPSDTWGRTWAGSEFSNTNFVLRITANTSANTLRTDAIQVNVHHQAAGGGSGGGGDVFVPPANHFLAGVGGTFDILNRILTSFLAYLY